MIPASAISRNEGFLQGVGRLRLFYRTWEVVNARAAVIVVHGLAEHSGRFDELGLRLGAAGHSTFALDLRGHGVSEGRRGHVPHFDAFLQDLDRFRREVQGLVRVELPLFLLGTSMGGLIALRYLEEYETPFRGAIAVSPWLATSMPVPRWKINIANALNRVLPALPLALGIDPTVLTRDPKLVQARRDDSLVHDRITPRLFAESATAMGLAFQRADRIHTPLLFLLAGDDQLVDTQKSLAFSRTIRSAPVTVKLYPGYYHEVMNEVDRGIVFTDLRDWLGTRLTQ